jgi:hypothetical protein
MTARVLTLLLLLALLLPGQGGLRMSDSHDCAMTGTAAQATQTCCCGDPAMACHGQCSASGCFHFAVLPSGLALAAPDSRAAFSLTLQRLPLFPPPAAIYHPPRRLTA